MSQLKTGDKVYCTGNRGIEWQFAPGKAYIVEDVYHRFGHEYVTVTGEVDTVHNIRAHRFTKVGEVR